MKIKLIFVLIWITITSYSQAFPGAEGFGRIADIYSSYEPKILVVDNLTDDNIGDEQTGRGSFRWCVTRPYPRHVLIEISGDNILTERLKIEHPYLYIAGQTAPGEGFAVHNFPIEINTHDVIVQNLIVRVGDRTDGSPPQGRGCFAINKGAYNVMIDHCSLSWSIDENISTWWTDGYEPVHNVSVTNCFITWALNCAKDSVQHPDPSHCHSKNIFAGHGSENISFDKNYIAFSNDRNPLFQGGVIGEIINNLIYDCKNNVSFSEMAQLITQASVINNMIVPGQDWDDSIAWFNDINPSAQVYLSGNSGFENDWLHVRGYNEGIPTKIDSPLILSNVEILQRNEIESYILKNAGARNWNRNEVDMQAVNCYLNGTGNVIDSVTNWHLLPIVEHTLDLPANPNGDNDLDGWTNIQEWLMTYKGGEVATGTDDIIIEPVKPEPEKKFKEWWIAVPLILIITIVAILGG